MHGFQISGGYVVMLEKASLVTEGHGLLGMDSYFNRIMLLFMIHVDPNFLSRQWSPTFEASGLFTGLKPN